MAYGKNSKDIKRIIQERFQAAEEIQRPRFQKFNDFDYIYHSRLKKYDPSVTSKVFNPIVWSFIETIVTRMLAKDPEIVYEPQGSTNKAQAQIVTDLFSYWYRKSDAYPTIVSWVKDALIYGTGIVKLDWYSSPMREIKSYQIDELGEAAVDPESGQLLTESKYVRDYDDPRIKNVNIYDFFVDPEATSIEEARWVIYRYYADIDALEAENDAAGEYGKTIYNKAQLKKLKEAKLNPERDTFDQARRAAAGLSTVANSDKTANRVEIWEMWQDDKVCALAEGEYLIRESENPYWHGKKPFIRLVDSIVPHEFYGKGEIEPVEKMLHALNTTTNQRIVNVSRILSPMWKAKEGVDDDELQFIDNGVIHVSDMDDTEFIAPPNVTQSSVQEQSIIVETIQRSLGVTDYVQGVTTPGQTKAEVEIKTAQANARFAHKVQLMEQMALKPLGEMVYQLYQQFVTREKVIRVTGAEGEVYVPVLPEDLSGEYDVIPESNSTLEVDRQAEFEKMLNLFGILRQYTTQTVVNPSTGLPEQVGFIDSQALVEMLLDKANIKDKQQLFTQNQPDGGINGNPIPGGQQLPGALPAIGSGAPSQGQALFGQAP